MRDKDYTVATDFLASLFSQCSQTVELRACPNVKGSSGALSEMTSDAAAQASFCERKDAPGMGTYFGVCTRQAGAKSGNLQSIAECPALWVDIDCKKQGLKGDEVLSTLAHLPYPPSITINSGGGLHAYWVLEEALDVTAGTSIGEEAREAVTDALRALVGILAGDMQCAELARIMRLPGTMNSKPETLALYDGEPFVCEVIENTGRVYDFAALEEWLGNQRALLHGKAETKAPVKEDNPFVAYAREAGFEPGIDIETELAAMEHGATGTRSIHSTQLRVSMSMIARGYEDDDIVSCILAATEAAAPRDAKWNWKREERAIRDMVESGRLKVIDRKPDRPKPTPQPIPQINGSAALKLVHSAEPEPKKKMQAADQVTALGQSALDVWRDRYGPILLSRGTSYCYEKGVWIAWDEQHDQMLRILMQEACASLGLAPKSALISAATLYFQNQPNLWEREVEFDAHTFIVAGDGIVDPSTGEIGPHSPDHRAQFKVGANLQGPRECKAFLSFLEESFVDKDEEEIPAIIATLQEWFGACLVANKSRALCKGLLVYGGSRTGKTQLSEILRALLGKGQTSATSAGDIGGDFGLQPFVGKRGWVADDAIGQGEYLDAERYKKIVTGEEIGVRRKNRTDLMCRFGFPVMLTSNNLPKVRDQSDAVYNRSLVLPMTHVRPESKPEPEGYHSISAKIIAEELTGVLWWAIEGWQRLHKRGVFVEPPCMKKAVVELQDNNNSVGAWIRECVEQTNAYKVANADLFASFAGWYYQENGEGKFPWSQNGFIRKIKEMLPNLGYQKGVKSRCLTGLRLTEDGLEYWSVNASREGNFVPKANAFDVSSVNQDYSLAHAERASKQHQQAPEMDRRPRF